ncbi:MAG: hypothetical protein ACI8XB_001767 [Patiriisocius sp.]|jgi:uncharacterized protein YciI
MKALIFSLFLFSLQILSAQEGKVIENENYDSELAKKLGADDYGMKMYVFVILKSGFNESDDKVARDSCFAGHMTNMGQLKDDGKLIVAGPMGENQADIRGIFILNVPTVGEAEVLLQTDPAIAADYLSAELYPWYGSAALPEYLDSSDKIWKVKP